MQAPERPYKLSCHCGSIRLEVDAELLARRLIFSVREVPRTPLSGGVDRPPSAALKTRNSRLPLMARPQQVRVRVSS
jgi:hypothetical protein